MSFGPYPDEGSARQAAEQVSDRFGQGAKVLWLQPYNDADYDDEEEEEESEQAG